MQTPIDEADVIADAAAALDDRYAAPRRVPGAGTEHVRLVPRTGASIDRRDLTNRDEIVERMARDILAARRDGQHGHLIDLTEFGWSQAQAMRWGSPAHTAAADPRVATQDVVERLASDEGAHIVALASIDVERIVAAGEAAVAEALGEIHRGHPTTAGADGAMAEIDPADDFGGAAA